MNDISGEMTNKQVSPQTEQAKIDMKASVKMEAAAKPSIREKRKKKSRRGLKGLPILIFFIVWEIFSLLNVHRHWINPVFLPAPSEIARTGWELAVSGILLKSIYYSTMRIISGFLIGSIFAILISIFMNRIRWLDEWVSPILNLTGPIPALALLPLFIIWFGIGEVPKIVLIAWTTFIPVQVYTMDGLRSVNSTLIRSALSLGASESSIFLKVILPSTLPSILVGAQVSLGLAFSSLIVSEMMGANAGLGYIIVDARNFFKISNMFVSIVVIGVEYSLLSYMLKFIERKVVFWRQGGMHEAVEK